MARTPQVGEQAPDFELPGTDGPFRLSDHRGERVVLLFYPGDNTMVCTKQFCSYRDRAGRLRGAERDGRRHLLAGPRHPRGLHRQALAQCPAAGRRGQVRREVLRRLSARLGTKRAVIVIDEAGIVRHRHDHLLGLDYQSVDELKSRSTRFPPPRR